MNLEDASKAIQEILIDPSKWVSTHQQEKDHEGEVDFDTSTMHFNVNAWYLAMLAAQIRKGKEELDFDEAWIQWRKSENFIVRKNIGIKAEFNWEFKAGKLIPLERAYDIMETSKDGWEQNVRKKLGKLKLRSDSIDRILESFKKSGVPSKVAEILGRMTVTGKFPKSREKKIANRAKIHN